MSGIDIDNGEGEGGALIECEHVSVTIGSEDACMRVVCICVNVARERKDDNGQSRR
jgi:hypothetical protein